MDKPNYDKCVKYALSLKGIDKSRSYYGKQL